MPFSQGHALIIGVGTYQHTPRMNVPITAADAEAVGAVLRDPALCGYPESQVTLLRDASASRDGILTALDALAARAGDGDTVLLFFCGHGDYGDDGDYYLTTHDTRIEGRKVVGGSGLRQRELIDKLRAIKARRLLLLVNACHAGELAPTLGPDEPPYTGTPLPAQTASALLSTGEGRIIITACRDQQVSYIGAGRLTLFTQALVDGLRGDGTSSNRGYLSAFDLYTHLYFTVSETVQQRYGATQEPELTVLKGVGPFAVALYRGATALGAFDGAGALPEGLAAREVSPARSRAMLEQLAPRQHQQSIGDNAQVGAAVAGDVHGDVNVSHREGDHVEQHGGVHFGPGGQFGDLSFGDIAGRDIIKTGDITGSSGVAIGRGARSTVRTVDTGGGDYAERSIDKRQGTFVGGDQVNVSGPVSGAILNIKSTLDHVTQSVAAAPLGDAGAKAQLQQLLVELSAALQRAPADRAEEAQQVARRAEAAVAAATATAPDREDAQYSLGRLRQAAAAIGAALPDVPPIADKLAAAVGGLIA